VHPLRPFDVNTWSHFVNQKLERLPDALVIPLTGLDGNLHSVAFEDHPGVWRTIYDPIQLQFLRRNRSLSIGPVRPTLNHCISRPFETPWPANESAGFK